MNEPKPLEASDIKSISKALLDWLRTCPELPKNVKFSYQYLEEKDESMSLHTLSGAKKSVQYVDGAYEGIYPFALYYRSSPDSTNKRIQCTELLDAIGSWVDEQSVYPELGDNRVINSISQITTSVLVKRFPNGYEDYMTTFNLVFERS